MRTLIIFTILLFYQSVKAQVETMKFKLDNDGIFVEDFDSLNSDENRYNLNNSIYTVNKKIYFDYYYLDTNNIKYLMTKDTSVDWALDKFDHKNPNSINKIIMTVCNGLSPFYPSIKDYNQTVILYDYMMIGGGSWTIEATGLIENSKNIWIHPPRTGLFEILELNPYPYLKSANEIGNKWEWKLSIGSKWSDKRWLEWTGNVLNKYDYEITQKLNLETKIGNLVCYEIVGIAQSELGKTKLISYFNQEYGFIKLDYTNIDKSKIIIEIDKFE